MLKKVNQKGFTIIEVLIVLAIAGVIMLVVFLAVPALQRNSRNTQRNNDAAIITAAINECLTNKNGVVASCDTMGEVKAVSLDTNKLRQLTNLPADATVWSTNSATAMTPPATNDAVAIAYARKCNSTGDADLAGSARQFAVLFPAESQSGSTIVKCLDS